MMAEDQQTACFGQGSKVDSVSRASGREMTHFSEAPAEQSGRVQARALGQRRGHRLMHQSTLVLGDQTSGTCYTTTHSQSYSGRTAEGQPLLFFPRDPRYPSLHSGQLELSDTMASQSQTHSRDVHRAQYIVASNVLHSLGQKNWMLNCEGVSMREVTNPPESTPYWTTYRSDHIGPQPAHSGQSPTGLPTQWHQHDIITGEQRSPAGPGKPRRRSGDRVLWAARRWETDCCALRLY